MKKVSGMSFVFIFVFGVLLSSCLNADDFFGVPPKGTPSVVNYGWQGMKLGAMIGLGAGYIQYVDGAKAKTIALDTAYGALAGTGVGLALGVYDASLGKKGYGAIVLRDMYLCGELGAAVGAICGTISALNNSKWENLGTGTAWGFIGGSVIGIGVAFYEGPKLVESQSSKNFSQGIGVLADSQQHIIPCLQVASKF